MGMTYHPRGQRIDGYAPREHPNYLIWAGMKSRCLDPKSTIFPNYGGRGIRVCDRWMHFANFVADMGVRPSPNHSLDRIDVDGPYAPDNCRWATRSEQCANRRKFKNNTTGVAGVVLLQNGSYHARFDYERRRYQIGWFDTLDEAAKAREAFVTLFFSDRVKAEAQLAKPTVRRTSTTGVRGVTRHPSGGFTARTTVGGVRHYLGYFPTIDAAASAIAAFSQSGTAART